MEAALQLEGDVQGTRGVEAALQLEGGVQETRGVEAALQVAEIQQLQPAPNLEPEIQQLYLYLYI